MIVSLDAGSKLEVFLHLPFRDKGEPFGKVGKHLAREKSENF